MYKTLLSKLVSEVEEIKNGCTHPGFSSFNDFAEEGREGFFFPDLGRALGGFFTTFSCDCFGVDVTRGTREERFSSGCSAKALSRSISSWAIGMYYKRSKMHVRHTLLNLYHQRPYDFRTATRLRQPKQTASNKW